MSGRFFYPCGFIGEFSISLIETWGATKGWAGRSVLGPAEHRPLWFYKGIRPASFRKPRWQRGGIVAAPPAPHPRGLGGNDPAALLKSSHHREAIYEGIFSSRDFKSSACSSSTLRMSAIIFLVVESSSPSQRTISEYDSIAIRSANRSSLSMERRSVPSAYSEWLRDAKPSGLKLGSPLSWVMRVAIQSACCCSSVACCRNSALAPSELIPAAM